MKKIKVTFDKNYNTYCVELNDGNKENVVFECDKCIEFEKYFNELPQPPEYIVMSQDIVKRQEEK